MRWRENHLSNQKYW